MLWYPTLIAGVYARAISLQLRNVELPEEYRESVSEKQSAAEDITLAQNQRSQETTKVGELYKLNPVHTIDP